MNFEDLTSELKQKAMQCKTPEDVLALAKEEGYELSEAEMEGIAGGVDWSCNDADCKWYDPEPHSR